MNCPTSKQPNPTKFHHNNRCLIPFFKKKVASGNKCVVQFVSIRKPGELIKSNDGKFTYQMQQNGALVKVATGAFP
jgi:hypothetical protein